MATLGVPGVTAMEVKTGAVTVRPLVAVTVPLTPDAEAVMLVAPCVTLAANPAALTVATAAFDEDHVAVLVMLCVVPSV